MELLKFFIKDEVPAVGLSKFKDRDKYYNNIEPLKLNIKPIFKPDYRNNFFLL